MSDFKRKVKVFYHHSKNGLKCRDKCRKRTLFLNGGGTLKIGCSSACFCCSEADSGAFAYYTVPEGTEEKQSA